MKETLHQMRYADLNVVRTVRVAL